MAGSAGRDYGDRAFHRACLLGDRTILRAYTSIGFWLVGGLLTLIYAAVFGLLAYFISEHDPIWGWERLYSVGNAKVVCFCRL